MPMIPSGNRRSSLSRRSSPGKIRVHRSLQDMNRERGTIAKRTVRSRDVPHIAGILEGALAEIRVVGPLARSDICLIKNQGRVALST